MFRTFPLWTVLLCIFTSMPCVADEETPSTLPYIVVLYGAPGSGRATMAIRLRRDFAFPTISLATLLANHVLEEATTEPAEGNDVPTNLLPRVLCTRLLKPDCSHGAFLEDMSLTPDQVRDIQRQLSSRFQFFVVNIDASDGWLVQRVEKRLVCHNCGYVCDETDPNRKGSTACDICSSPLQRRQGDSPEIIKARLDGYRHQLAPLLDMYQEQGVLVQVCGDRKFEDTYLEILRMIEHKTGLVASKNHIAQDHRDESH
jgi:adenylate kinase